MEDSISPFPSVGNKVPSFPMGSLWDPYGIPMVSRMVSLWEGAPTCEARV